MNYEEECELTRITLTFSAFFSPSDSHTAHPIIKFSTVFRIYAWL